ncbi:MAG: GspH/FimT family pseudopilin [Gammaproteobacteria bacterium]|nr:GspH/FimT family pseudopilin [Gammaproteobacteria bacterium]
MKADNRNSRHINASPSEANNPFVCLIIPFVCWTTPNIIPFIRRKKPSIPLCRNLGFSMIEILVTLVVIAIVAALAIPNFRGVIQNNRLVTQANSLLTDLTLARSEAIKRSGSIGICRSTTGASCSNAGNWENGWLVFVDTNSNGTWDNTDQPLRFHKALAGGNTLRPNATGIVEPILLSSRGTSNIPDGGGFRLCDDRGTASGKSILINRIGQVRIEKTPPDTCP